MAKAKKALKITAWILGILLALIVIVILLIDPIAKFAIEKVGSKVTGVDISVGSISISPFRCRVELREMVVGNPQGYASDHAISLGFVNAEVDPRTLFDKKLVVREVTLKDVNVNFEGGITGSNLTDILANVKEFTNAEEKEEKTKEKKEQRLQVDHFELHKVGVHVIVKGMGSEGAGVAVTIEPLKDLGTDDEGITPAELVFRVLGAIIRDSMKQGVFSVSGSVIDLTNGAVDSVKDLTGSAVSGVKDSVSGVLG